MIEVILFTILGTVSGIFFGLIPGAGPFVAVAAMTPLLASYSASSIIAYYVAVLIATNYTNSVTAILYGIPGDATAISTARYGHAFFRKGYGSYAVSSNAISSTIGVIFATLVFLIFYNNIISVFSFYNSMLQTLIIFLAIILITFFNKQNYIISIAFFVFGTVLSKIGIDPVTFKSWGTFGIDWLTYGIPFSAVMIGLYLVPEILKIHSLDIKKPKQITKFNTGKNTLIPSLLGSFIGFWSGLIPGITNILGSYASAKIVKRYFRLPNLKSIAAAEAANNSGALSSLLPLLILAIPITGSEVLVYYLVLEQGFTFNSQSIYTLIPILYCVPFIALFCMFISWYGFNLLSNIVYFYKNYKWLINGIILTTICTVSIAISSVKVWMIVCLFVLMVLGYILRYRDTTPILYGFFLGELLYESLTRTLVIIS